MKIRIDNVTGFSGTIDVPDVDGIPTERFWRNRLKDAELDGCCEVVKPRTNKRKEKKK
jgi:hypothetical protein